MIKRISIIITNDNHPINKTIEDWIEVNESYFDITLVRAPENLKGGDILFLISCNDIIKPKEIKKYEKCLVIHASDLPKGRGFSPHIWGILNGESSITISLIEASEKVDRGDIWKKINKNIPKYYLYEDIIKVVNDAHVELMDFAIMNFDKISPIKQSDAITPTYYPKRNPEDSQIDVNKSIKDQFNLMRVSDKNRFPSFFKIHGMKYKIIIEHYED